MKTAVGNKNKICRECKCRECKYHDSPFTDEPCWTCTDQDCKFEPKEPEPVRRPKLMPGPAPYYDHAFSEIPEKIRVSFDDGQTAVYELRTEQPHPLVLRNIEIMRETKKKITYINQPARRRK